MGITGGGFNPESVQSPPCSTYLPWTKLAVLAISLQPPVWCVGWIVHLQASPVGVHLKDLLTVGESVRERGRRMARP